MLIAFQVIDHDPKIIAFLILLLTWWNCQLKFYVCWS